MTHNKASEQQAREKKLKKRGGGGGITCCGINCCACSLHWATKPAHASFCSFTTVPGNSGLRKCIT